MPAEKAQAAVVDPSTAFANGTATAGVDRNGTAITPDEDGVFHLTVNGTSGNYAVPTYVLPEGADSPVAVTIANKTYGGSIYKDEAGTQPISSIDADLTTPGTFYIKMKPADPDTTYGTSIVMVKFVIEASSLAGVTVYEKHDGSTSTADTEFTYNGGSQKIDLPFNINSAETDAKQVVATFYNAKGEKLANGYADIVDAGDYKVVVSGKDAASVTPGSAEYAGATVTIPFTVNKLDLASANVVVDDVQFTAGNVNYYTTIAGGTTINGVAVGTFTGASPATVEFTADPVSKTGTYNATVKAAANQDNVIGEKTVSFNAVTTKVADTAFLYDGTQLDLAVNSGGKLNGATFDLSQKQGFDADKITVTGGYELDEDYTVTLTNEDGEIVANADAAGTYTVTVSMIPGSDYALGGKASATFTVINGSMANASAVFTYKGQVVGDNTTIAIYDGTNVLDDLAVQVKMGKQVLAEGTDYTVSYAKGTEDVTEAVDAGNYTMTVTGITYDGDIVFHFTIGKAQITNIRVQQQASAVQGIPYTGEAVTPVVEFTTDGEWNSTENVYDVPENAEWTVLPADQYVATYANGKGETVRPENLIEVGDDYTVSVRLNAYANNVAFATTPGQAGTTATFNIVEVAGFADVAADAWYADEVALAASDGYGYMTGIPGTNLFMPEAQITRAQTAQVLFNMAGGVSKTGYYPTAFSDVNGWAWYAQPIAWASQASIVTGIGDTGAFAPDENVTREQAATMLYRYMKAQGKDVSATADLSAYVDGASVSDWAAEAMQWAVANDVFGVNTDQLRPQENLSRAEMAAIAVRVQPDGAIEEL